jgi:hypothetical protein
MKVKFNPDTGAQDATEATTNTAPSANVISVKNVTSDTVRTEYQMGSSAFPQLTIIDAAQANGVNFYLRSDGNVVDSAGSVKLSYPPLQSIAYVDPRWYALRSDGAVLKATTAGATLPSDITGFTPTGVVIPTAISLAMGKGP